MGIVALTDERSRLVVRSRVLHVERGGSTHAIPLAEIDEVMVHGAAEVTPAARNLLLRSRIDVSFFSGAGRYLGRLAAASSGVAARRLAWYRLADEEARCLGIGRVIIEAKLRNQRHILLVRQRRARRPEVADVLVALRAQREAVRGASTREAIMGHEGVGARHHYRGLSLLLRHATITFEGRNRRPPRDPVNACLSYGYALLQSRVEHAVWRAGLEPGLGVLHSAERGAPALALDVMEPFRPVIDDMVLTLMNRGQLSEDDFRHPVDGEAGLDAVVASEAVYLGKVGRAVMLQAWARTLERAYPSARGGGKVRLPTAILEAVQQLAALAEGRIETWTPFKLE